MNLEICPLVLPFGNIQTLVNIFLLFEKISINNGLFMFLIKNKYERGAKLIKKWSRYPLKFML